jgi:proton-translocating NADH-quinone oxidoreductase chain M
MTLNLSKQSYIYNSKYLYFDISLIIFFIFNFIWILFDPFEASFQFVYFIDLFEYSFLFGIDGISIFFIYLSTFLIPLCLLFSFYNMKQKSVSEIKRYQSFLFLTLFLLIFVFSALDILVFYIMFEIILIPFFILIGISSYRKRRIHASYLFFFYTLIGSFLMLVAIFSIYSYTGTSNIEVLLNNKYSFYRENIVWLTFFISFAIKIPMFPFHVWLPEAHVEAPTEGSVLLAGVLLKLGSYGFLRFLMPLFPNSTYYFSPLVILVSCLGIFYTSFVTLKQIDIKRIIAYSSVSHMNVCILGLFSFHSLGIAGSIHLMIAHGLVSGGLFFLVGMLYNRYHTKLLKYYSGLVYTMPLFSFFLFVFIVGNISFPLTSNFIGEFLIIVSLFLSFNYYALIFTVIGVFICTVYSLWLYNKLVFMIPKYKYIKYTNDLSFLECSLLLIILFFVFWLGIYPYSIFSILDLSINYYYFDLLYK